MTAAASSLNAQAQELVRAVGTFQLSAADSQALQPSGPARAAAPAASRAQVRARAPAPALGAKSAADGAWESF